MNIITLTKDNLEKEHICCAISNNSDCQVMSKKKWLAERFDDGLVFKKSDLRGKCFIEYIPAEKAWIPIEAEGFMYIDCFWVSGQLKGNGYANMLLDDCIKDSKAKGKKGLVVLSSKKKMAFLSDPNYLKYKGFQFADSCQPFFELLYLPFEADCEKPKFKDHLKNPNFDCDGFVLYYANQCPFTAKYVPVVEKIAQEKGVKFTTRHLETCADAQNAPTPFTSYTLFYNGKFITNEILSDKKFEKILAECSANN